MYGAEAAADAIAAWKIFSDAFTEFPYGVAIYVIPTQHGPANLLRIAPTKLKPGMILFPYDAYKTWCGPYPPEVVCSQFRVMAAKWRTGLERLSRAAALASPAKQKSAQRELAIARTCLNHFASTANQIEFYLLRDGPLRSAGRMSEILKEEMQISRDQYFVARGESLVGYEASNHYYYTPLDLVEKMLNCEWIDRALHRQK
jgi:hypothetical protein